MSSTCNCTMCEHQHAYPTRGFRYEHYCRHPNQPYIDRYAREHNIQKSPNFIGFSKLNGEFPIKRTPKWCPKGV